MDNAESKLRSLGIEDFKPGMQDLPAFLEAEKVDPGVVELLAYYVEERQYSPAYLTHVRSVINEIVPYLHAGLTKNGRLGACVDASGALARMLDEEGIWNYCVKSAMSTYPEPWTHIEPSFYAPISNQTRSTAATCMGSRPAISNN